MKSFLLVATFAALLTASSITPANAIVLFDNGDPDPSSAFSAEGDSGFLPGNIFTANISGIADTLNFAGRYNGTATDSFSIRLYSVNGSDAPGTLLESSGLSGVSETPLTPYANSYAISGNLETPFTLTAGTSYFLAFQDSTSPNQNFSVIISDSGPANDFFDSYDNGGTFYQQSHTSFAFSLDGLAGVPEASSSWALLVIAVLFVGARIVRSRRI